MAKGRRRRVTSLGALVRDFADQGVDLARDEFRDGVRDFTARRPEDSDGESGSGGESSSGADERSGRLARRSRREDRGGDANRDDQRAEIDQLRAAVTQLTRKLDELGASRAERGPGG